MNNFTMRQDILYAIYAIMAQYMYINLYINAFIVRALH